MLRRLLGPVLALLLAAAGLAHAQTERYEAMYGTPVDVNLSDLSMSAVSYEGRAIRTKGRFEIGNSPGQSGRVYLIRDMGGAVYITPVREMAGYLDSEGMSMLGHDVEVTGVFQSLGGGDVAVSNQASGVIQFWKFLGPPEKPTKSALDAAKTWTLEGLLAAPDKAEGKTIRVVGKFRGKNLYGDLPIKSQRDSSDWVIKDDIFAIWVTGRKPKGDGFQLDSNLKRDTGRWLEVVGRIATRGGVVYMQAMYVGLGSEPRPHAEVKAPPPPPEKPKLAPVVVFALPLDGDVEVPSSTRFYVQFSKDMDESSFKGNVVVRYAGAVQPGDRAFDGVRLSYDGGRRTLEVDPGDDLRFGRTVEVLLLPGIKDIDGLDLLPRHAHEGGEVVEMLRYRVSASR